MPNDYSYNSDSHNKLRTVVAESLELNIKSLLNSVWQDYEFYYPSYTRDINSTVLDISDAFKVTRTFVRNAFMWKYNMPVEAWVARLTGTLIPAYNYKFDHTVRQSTLKPIMNPIVKEPSIQPKSQKETAWDRFLAIVKEAKASA